jgi:glycosyltransferase involved in cell wall biosynthesis
MSGGRSGPATVVYSAWAPFFSGAERALVILLENLDRSRFRPVVVLGTRGDLESELAAIDVATVHVPLTYRGKARLPAWVAGLARLRTICRREEARLVHANDVPSFQSIGYVARHLGIPAITHVRFPDTEAGFGWFLKAGFARAVFVSGALQADAEQAAPAIFRGRSEVVHDGVRMPNLPDASGRQAIRVELGLPLDRAVVALTGQIAEIKGIWDFLEAATALASRRVPAVFAILGDDLKGHGALRREAERLVHERGLAEHVRFLGFRRDAPRLIPAFDVVAVPSHVEPLGNATLEAMAAGVPVVGSRVGGIPEMVVDGETGLLVPPRVPAALAAAMERLVHDGDAARTMGRAGRHRAAEAFGVTAHARRVEQAYDRVLSLAGDLTGAAV